MIFVCFAQVYNKYCKENRLDVCQAYAESHGIGIIFICSKDDCMTFKAKSAKSSVTPFTDTGWSKHKICWS